MASQALSKYEIRSLFILDIPNANHLQQIMSYSISQNTINNLVFSLKTYIVRSTSDEGSWVSKGRGGQLIHMHILKNIDQLSISILVNSALFAKKKKNQVPIFTFFASLE